MVSNYDRIYREIKKEAQNLVHEDGIEPEVLVILTMDIVDLVDQHRTKHIHGINQEIKRKIETTAVIQPTSGG